MKQQRQFVVTLVVVLLAQIAVCVFGHESKLTTPHFHLRHCNMSAILQNHNEDIISGEVAVMNLEDNGSPRTEFRLTADSCDCGMLMGCRCSDSLWDMVLERVDESDMEEGMMDQGYRQHV